MTKSNQTPNPTRRRFLRTTGVVTGALTLGITATGSSVADPSNNPALPGRVYADGRTFATKDATDLPPPKGNNEHSFDEIYHFTNGASGQLDVAEAAPGEQDFNGGRWSVTVVEWTISDPPVVKSDDEVHAHSNDIDVVEEGARYFECPLVPLEG
ncbi:twin-arginine translocation signal domain-containing protein [Halorussus salinisoli]|uniref:twin-arginine translocation signal domain-containing protein n=1 Tax=Halorussus salinisoli TaxID=2558242 RepID=UPI0010C15FF6|nr:twin-arginine translocation signal domain-containing protein [Halorussus salinisoli]